MGRYPALFEGSWAQLKHTALAGETPPLLKELIAFVISVDNKSPYCSSAHAHTAMRLDETLTYEILLDLGKGKMADQLPRPYRMALEVVPRVIKDPQSISPSDIAALKDVDFDDKEIAELFAGGYVAVMFNILTAVHNVPSDDAFRPVLDDLQDEK